MEEYLAQATGKSLGVPWKVTGGFIWDMMKKDTRNKRAVYVHLGKRQKRMDEETFVNLLVPEEGLHDRAAAEKYVRDLYNFQELTQQAAMRNWGEERFLEEVNARNMPIQDEEYLKKAYTFERDRWTTEAEEEGGHLGSRDAWYKIRVTHTDVLPWNWPKAIIREGKSLVGQWIWHKAEKSLYAGLQIADASLKSQAEQLSGFAKAAERGPEELREEIEALRKDSERLDRLKAELNNITPRKDLLIKEEEARRALVEHVKKLEGNWHITIRLSKDPEKLRARFEKYIEAGKLGRQYFEAHIAPLINERVSALALLEKRRKLGSELISEGVHFFDTEKLGRNLEDIEKIKAKLAETIKEREGTIRKWFGARTGQESLFGDQGRIWAWNDFRKNPRKYLVRRLVWKEMKLPGGKVVGLNLKAKIWGDKNTVGFMSKIIGKKASEAIGGGLNKITVESFRLVSRAFLRSVNWAASKVGLTLFETGGATVATTTAEGAVVATGGAAAAASPAWVSTLFIGCGCLVIFFVLLLAIVVIIFSAFKNFDTLVARGTSPSESAQLSISKSVNKVTASAGETLNYTITLTAKEDVTNAQIQDYVAWECGRPRHLILDDVLAYGLVLGVQNAVPPPSGMLQRSRGFGFADCTSTEAVWEVGDLAAGDSFTITYAVKIHPDYDASWEIPIANEVLASGKTSVGEEADPVVDRTYVNAVSGLPPTIAPVEGGYCPDLGEYGAPRESCNAAGVCTSYSHEGIDTAVARSTPISSPFPGEAQVVAVGSTYRGGRYLTLRSASSTGDSYEVTFRHLESVNGISRGDTVSPGQVVAFVNNTGTNTTGDHLHYEVRKNGRLVDPCSVGVDAPCCH